jgi:hypothetical protein
LAPISPKKLREQIYAFGYSKKKSKKIAGV